MTQLVYGTQRADLRLYCLNQVAVQMQTWPDKRAILIVPEQSKMDMEKDFLALSGQESLLLAEVLSFRRLAWRLLSEAGAQPAQTIDAVGQAILIQQILKQNQKSLPLFGRLADKPGFIKHVNSVLGDFKRYQISSAQLQAAAVKCKDMALAQKVAEFAFIQEAYELALAQTDLSDAEDDLNRLSGLLQHLLQMSEKKWPWPYHRLDWLRQARIWVNGFGELRNFTPQETAILQALTALSEQVVITVAADRIPVSRHDIENGSDNFQPGRRTAWHIKQQLPIRLIKPLARTGTSANDLMSEVLRENRRQAFDPVKENTQLDILTQWLHLVRAPDPEQEIRWVAGEIRRLVQCEGFRYRDIVIAACDLSAYAPKLRAICREYDLPLFLDADYTLTGTSLLRLVLGLLDIELTNWSSQAVMSFLRCGLLPADQGDLDQLENHALAWGLFRADRIFDPRFDDPAKCTEQDLPALRDALLRPVRLLLKQMRQAASAADKCRLLQHYLLEQGIKAKLEERISGLTAAGEMEDAVILAKSWNELDRIMHQMIQLNAVQSLGIKAFRDSLAAGMEAAQTSVIPTAVDQISIGDLRHGMLRQPAVIFIIGASAARLPPAWPAEGLLKDQDRLTLSDSLDCELPSHVRDQAYADQFMIYTLLTLPESKLYLSCSGRDESPWFRWLENLLPHPVLELSEYPDIDDARLNGLQPAFSYWLSRNSGMPAGERSVPFSGGWQMLGDLLRQQAELPWNSFRTWLTAGDRELTAAGPDLPPALVQSLYGETVTMSVSQLEQYAGCPFRHLALSLLKLRERAAWVPQAAEIGTVLHGMVEIAFTELRRELELAGHTGEQAIHDCIESWLSADLELAAQSWLEQAAVKSEQSQFMEMGLRASLARRAGRLAAASMRAMVGHLHEDLFLPDQLEWTFGPERGAHYFLEPPGLQKIELRGIIDRIDQKDADGKCLFRIIDYKSGRKSIDYDALYHGLDLQLPLYLAACRQNRPDCLAADAAYFQFDRPLLLLDHAAAYEPERVSDQLKRRHALQSFNTEPEMLQAISLHARDRAGYWAQALLQGQFKAKPARMPGKNPACAWCQLHALCGFDQKRDSFHWLKPLDQILPSEFGKEKRKLFFGFLSENEGKR